MLSRDSAWTIDEYQKVFNLQLHFIAIISQDGTFLKVNEETLRLLDCEHSELTALNFFSVIHPDDLQVALNFFHSKLTAGNLTIRCRSGDQSYRPITWSIKFDDGKFFASGTEVSEKVLLEEKLSFQTLVLESISEGVVIINSKHEIIYVNSSEVALFGYDDEELIGKPISILNAYHEEETERYLREVTNYVRTRGMWQGEWLNVKKDKTKFITSCRVTFLKLNGEEHTIIVHRDITGRKRFEQIREALQSRFKTFFEQSSVAMQIYDLEGNLLVVNKACCHLFDYTADDMIGFNILKHPSVELLGNLPYVKQAFTGQEVEIPAFYLDPSMYNRPGRARWLEAWLSPIKDDNGRIKEMAVFFKDVTEKVETHNQLQKSILDRKRFEDRLSMAVKVGKVGIWEWIPGSKEVYFDETIQTIYGLELEDSKISLKEYLGSVHPDDRDLLLQQVKESQEEKRPYLIEHRIFRKDGELRWIQEAGTTIFNQEGKPVLMMGTCSDITNKKVAALDQRYLSEASEILSRSFNFQENVQTMADHSIEYFCDACIVDQLKPDGSIERIVVSARDQKVKERIKDIQVKYPQRYGHDHFLFNTLVTGKTYFLEDVQTTWSALREKHGEEYVQDLSFVNPRGIISARLKGRDSLLGTITFMTLEGSTHSFSERHKHLAEEIAYRTSMSLENSLLYLHSQEAIKSRDEFLSIASHELKTPLTSLTLQNQMRKRQLDKGEGHSFEEAKFRKMIEADDRQLRRINRLIDDMLDIARIRAHRLTIHKEVFDFGPFVTDVVERVAPQMEAAGCSFTLKLCEDVQIEADIYRIEQVIVNILTNALKYGAGRPIRIELEKFNYKVRLLVHDEGPGINPEDSERIFQRFERATHGREISGLGLGLYISRQIVQQHDGALYVVSERGKGSTFVMELPR